MLIFSPEPQPLVIDRKLPGGGRDKFSPFKDAFALLESVQLGILRFNVDGALVSF